MESASKTLSLRPISPAQFGEPVRAVPLPMEGQLLIGRSAEADWPLPDPSVSRRHAVVSRHGDTWLLTDLISRHGTSINSQRIDANTPAPIEEGDVIAFGSWRCRCTSSNANPGVTTPFAQSPADPASVSAIPGQQLGGVAQRGLDVLMELTAALESLDTRQAVAQAAADAVRRATGWRRVIVVEIASEPELAVLGSTSEEVPKVSRSLLEQAAQQGLVQMTVQQDARDHAHSIMELGIRSAICAPIHVDGAPAAFMTIDTRDAEGVVPMDAASFCQSVARLVGLGFQRISATAMRDRHRQLQEDLSAARRAQELLSPPKKGRHGSVAYCFESIPGRVVAGDLFDVFPLDANRTAFFLGDVSGKGVGAAMLMAACQSALRTRLLSGASLAQALTDANADLHKRTDASKFITLIAGVFDTSNRVVTLADAGHGFALGMRRGQIERIESDSGFPLGIVADAEYAGVQLSLEDYSGLVVFSDGAVEQPDAHGTQFGVDGVVRALEQVHSVDLVVAGLVDAVSAHAGVAFADDLTAAALWVE